MLKGSMQFSSNDDPNTVCTLFLNIHYSQEKKDTIKFKNRRKKMDQIVTSLLSPIC